MWRSLGDGEARIVILNSYHFDKDCGNTGAISPQVLVYSIHSTSDEFTNKTLCEAQVLTWVYKYKYDGCTNTNTIYVQIQSNVNTSIVLTNIQDNIRWQSKPMVLGKTARRTSR